MSVVKDENILAALRAAKLKGKRLAYTVVGAGNGGLAMAGHLGLMGFPVTLYNRTAEHLAGVRWRGGIDLKGAVSGFGPVARVSSDIAGALEGADVVMVVTPSTAHRALAEAMAPHLKDGQVVVLNPGRTGGALEFKKTLRDSKAPGKPLVAEAQTFIYASRAVSRHEAYIFRIKNGVPLATLPAFWTPEVLGLLELAYPQFSAGGDVLSTSMPLVGPAVYRRLFAALATRESEGLLSVPLFASFRGEAGHPVFVPASLAPRIAALPPGGKLRPFLLKENPQFVECSDESVLLDLDDRAAYEAALEKGSLRRSR